MKVVFIITCPRCGAKDKAEWDNNLPPGGVSPVQCKCGYIILSESEGNPAKRVKEV
jgi:hypothetical protein